MNVTTYVRLIACGLVLSFAASTANATPLSFTTVFGPGAAGVGGDLAEGVGEFPSDDVLGAIANFSDFSVQNIDDGTLPASPNEGQIIFFQNGGFYVGGAGPAAGNPLTTQGEINLGGPVVNNRAFGVFGTGRSDFTFTPGVVTSIDLQARGTNEDLFVGPADIGQSLPTGTELGVATALIEVYTDIGLEVTQTISNADFETLSIDISGLDGSSITRVSLINQGPLNSAIALGELTVGTIGVDANGIAVPEPASFALLGLAAGLTTLRRRR